MNGRDGDERCSVACVVWPTSRIYEKDFLTIGTTSVLTRLYHFGEDYLFNLECYGNAEKGVLPSTRMIGIVINNINSSFLVQGGNVSPETLIAYAQGYKRYLMQV